LRWSGGLYYLNIDREVGVNTAIDSGTGVVKSLYVPNNGASGLNNATEQLIHDQFDSDIYAVFGQIAFDITDGLEAAFALRYDREERDAKSLVPTVADGATAEFITCADPGQPPNAEFTDPINPGLCPDVNPSGVFTPRDKTFDEWQPKISLTWDIFPTVTAYTSLGVGFKSGGFNGQGSEATIDKYINVIPGMEPDRDICLADANDGIFCTVDISDDYKKETSTSFELGVKSTIGDSIRWEAAYYHVEVDDMQFFEFVVGPFGLMRVIENIDEATMDGFEATVVWSATDWLNVFAGGNWIDSEIDKNSVRPDTVGNESPYTPEWTANFGGDVVFPITSALNLIGSIDFSGFGDTWFHVVQDQQRPTAFGPGEYSIAQRDSYWLINARLGFGADNWSVVAFGRNIGDEDWLQEVIPAPEFGGSFTHPGTLSRFGIEMTYRF
jgi:iron complex outermembrane receptor protein